MPKCPLCEEEIDELWYEEEVMERGTLTIKDGELKFNEDVTEGETLNLVVKCPRCERDLNFGNDDAEHFLKGEPVSELCEVLRG